MVGVKVIKDGDEGVVRRGNTLYYGFIEVEIDGKNVLVCNRCMGKGGNSFRIVSHIFGKSECSAAYQCDCGNSLGYVLSQENFYLD